MAWDRNTEGFSCHPCFSSVGGPSATGHRKCILHRRWSSLCRLGESGDLFLPPVPESATTGKATEEFSVVPGARACGMFFGPSGRSEGSAK
eukprot:8960114-Alexandrium_andersonii.AAC.1